MEEEVEEEKELEDEEEEEEDIKLLQRERSIADVLHWGSAEASEQVTSRFYKDPLQISKGSLRTKQNSGSLAVWNANKMLKNIWKSSCTDDRRHEKEDPHVLQENAADVIQWKLLRDGRRHQHPGRAPQGSWKPFWHRCANKSRSDTGKKVNTKQSRKLLISAVPVERQKNNKGENMLELSYVYFLYYNQASHIAEFSFRGQKEKIKFHWQINKIMWILNQSVCIAFQT